jgi:formylglycine-generating enzyme required for sulfatase activity
LPDANEALALDPKDAVSYTTRGLIHQALGKPTEAVADLRQALALDPSNEEVTKELQKIEQGQVAAAEAKRRDEARKAAELRRVAQDAEKCLAQLISQPPAKASEPALVVGKDANPPRPTEPSKTPEESGEPQKSEQVAAAEPPKPAPAPDPAAEATPPPSPNPEQAELAKPGAFAAAVIPSSRPPEPLSAPEEAALKPKDAFKECPACPELIVVPIGEFTMGSNDGEADEKPVRRIVLDKAFAVGRFEVTFAEWDTCVADGGCKHKPEDRGWGRGNRPVINVSWNDVAEEFLPWISRKTGKQYRLLTEAEWEYVARAGGTGKLAWGDEVGRGRANCDGCGSQWDNKQTAPVGSFEPNAFGLYDVHGNAAEWVADCKTAYDKAALAGQASPESEGCNRVLRGGSWYNRTGKIRAAFRGKASPAERLDWVGFRLARTLNQ